jgi:hypothetical protein
VQSRARGQQAVDWPSVLEQEREHLQVTLACRQMESRDRVALLSHRRSRAVRLHQKLCWNATIQQQFHGLNNPLIVRSQSNVGASETSQVTNTLYHAVL